MEMTFDELRCKQVINIVDGTLLGNVIDLTFHRQSGRITGLIVPGAKSGFWFFKKCEQIFIPYNKICKIGTDVILVELCFQNNSKGVHKHSVQTQNINEQNQLTQNFEGDDN